MSEPMTCPKCGAGVRPWCDESPATEDRLFWCGRLERVIKGRMWDVIESETCLRRQLAQRDERNAALEARIKELESGLAALAPVVRAAGVLSEEGQTLDTRPTWVERAWAVIYAFRALTPEQRARLEEP